MTVNNHVIKYNAPSVPNSFAKSVANISVAGAILVGSWGLSNVSDTHKILEQTHNQNRYLFEGKIQLDDGTEIKLPMANENMISPHHSPAESIDYSMKNEVLGITFWSSMSKEAIILNKESTLYNSDQIINGQIENVGKYTTTPIDFGNDDIWSDLNDDGLYKFETVIANDNIAQGGRYITSPINWDS